MKRWVWVVLAVLLLLTGCNRKETEETLPSEPVVQDSGRAVTLMLLLTDPADEARLQAISSAGVDLDKVAVLAGIWGNEEQAPRILELKAEGFTQSAELEPDAGYAELLQYAWDSQSAEGYALILWDDRMDGAQMRQFMEDSPFGGENKLAWVGFDARLRATAEMACLWADYADYLVASQEAEACWDYGFLQNLTDQRLDLLEKIVQEYPVGELGALSCLDLSKAAALEQALGQAFRDRDYEVLAAARARAYTPGRYAVGSETDLVDLAALAAELEAAELTDAVADMVLCNAAADDRCQGLSLYYPFRNRQDYQRDYEKIGVLEDYAAFLEEYCTYWQAAEPVTGSALPQSAGEGVYTLKMEPDQAATFAEASYYILCRESGEIYQSLFSSSAVTRQGDTLTASFDGRILYAYYGGESCPLWVTPYPDGRWGVNMTMSLGKEETSRCRYLLENNGTELRAMGILGQDLENITESQITSYNFIAPSGRVRIRDDRGVMQATDQWKWIKYGYWQLPTDTRIKFAALPGGEYCLMFEIRDIYGNVYCTETAPLEIPGDEEPAQSPELLTVDWQSGDRVELLSRDGVTVYLTTVKVYDELRYTLSAENASGQDVKLQASELAFGGISVAGEIYLNVPAGQSVTEDFGYSATDPEAAYSVVDDARVIEFRLTCAGNHGNQWVQDLRVNLSDSVLSMKIGGEAEQILAAQCGIFAGEQVLFDDGVGLTLKAMGQSGSYSAYLDAYLYVENNTDQTVTLSFAGANFDGVFLNSYENVTLGPGKRSYLKLSWFDTDLKLAGIDHPSAMTLHWRLRRSDRPGTAYEDITSGVTLVPQKQEAGFVEGDRVVYEGNGIRLAIRGQRALSDWYEWECTLVNMSGQDIHISGGDTRVNGVERLLGSLNVKCGAGQKTVFTIFCDPTEVGMAPGTLPEMTCRLEVFDFLEQNFLWESDEEVVFTWQ